MPRGKYDRTKFKKSETTVPPAQDMGGVIPSPVPAEEFSPPEATTPAKEVPEMIFVFVAMNCGELTERIYAHDLGGNGCLVRTVYTKSDASILNICMTFVPGMCVRDGKMIRSLN